MKVCIANSSFHHSSPSPGQELTYHCKLSSETLCDVFISNPHSKNRHPLLFGSKFKTAFDPITGQKIATNPYTFMFRGENTLKQLVEEIKHRFPDGVDVIDGACSRGKVAYSLALLMAEDPEIGLEKLTE